MVIASAMVMQVRAHDDIVLGGFLFSRRDFSVYHSQRAIISRIMHGRRVNEVESRPPALSRVVPGSTLRDSDRKPEESSAMPEATTTSLLLFRRSFCFADAEKLVPFARRVARECRRISTGTLESLFLSLTIDRIRWKMLTLLLSYLGI